MSVEFKYPNLFKPIKIGGTIAKNRIWSAPQGMSDLTPDGYFTPQNIAFYQTKAKAGLAVVSLGEAIIDRVRAKAHGRMIALDDIEVISSLINCSDAIHQYGSLASIELVHAGCRARPEYCQKGPVGPSAHMGIYGEMVTEMDEDIIEEIVESFGKAAFMAKFCGIDICCIHASHGWIFSQFMAPATNQRKDKYGGSVENRSRFARMVLERIRKYCGSDYPIEWRISGSDLYEGGVTIEESIEYARILDGLVDILHVSAGSFNVPDTSTRMFPSMYLPDGVNVTFAEQIKRHVKKSAVATVGALGNDPAYMEELIKSGKVDILNIARASITDFDVVNKIRRGEADEVVPCLRCNMCLSMDFVPHVPFAMRVHRCSVNPEAGREYEVALKAGCSENPRRVLVVGGGPGGLQAAITAAKRGHEVILCEKSPQLGGMLNSAEGMEFKRLMLQYRDALITLAQKAKIKILLNTEVTPELAEQFRPDVVIAALGGEAVLPPIPGIDGENVYVAARDFGQGKTIGEKVVIVGGGLVGCEEGIHYRQQGKDVTILEMGDALARDAWFLHKRATFMQMEELGVVSHTGFTCTRISDKGVYATDADGKEIFFQADTVVIAAGLRPREAEAEALRFTAPEFSSIGDCVRCKTIYEASRTGYDAAVTL